MGYTFAPGVASRSASGDPTILLAAGAPDDRSSPVAVPHAVTGGPMIFPIEHAERLVRPYRDWIGGQPDDIYAFLALLTVPPAKPFPEELRGRPACALMRCNTAPEGDSGRAMAPFRAQRPLFDGGTAAVVTAGVFSAMRVTGERMTLAAIQQEGPDRAVISLRNGSISARPGPMALAPRPRRASSPARQAPHPNREG